MADSSVPALQNALRNDLTAIGPREDRLEDWVVMYLRHEVTTSESTRKVQARDLGLFVDFFSEEAGGTTIGLWTLRLSETFKTRLRATVAESGRRRWSDRTVNRILAHLKTFSKWLHRHRPFPLGDPMEKIKSVPTRSLLEVERALTPAERRRMLDAADLLLETGGRSVDRHRCRNAAKRPRRKDFRPYRNRAIVYTLIETGMRRAAAARINLVDVDFDRQVIHVEEKGGVFHPYNISRQGIEAVRD